jgi:hypothetical protein
MAVDPIDLDPELRELVARARRRAEEAGELRPPSHGPIRSSISPEAQAVIMEWLRDGGYAEAVARIAAEDPDLADQ